MSESIAVSYGQYPAGMAQSSGARTSFFASIIHPWFKWRRRVIVMNKRGCGIIFHHPRKDAVMVFRRDDAEGIPFPDMLDLLGGHVEEGETPEEAVVREMAEELIDLRTGQAFVPGRLRPLYRYVDGRGCEQNIFVSRADFEIEDLRLLEGRDLVWVSREEVAGDFRMAFGFEEVLRRFFFPMSVENR